MLNLLTLLLSQQPVLPQTAPAQTTPTTPANAPETAIAPATPTAVATPEYIAASALPTPPHLAPNSSLNLAHSVSLPQWNPSTQPAALSPEAEGEPTPPPIAAAKVNSAQQSVAPASQPLSTRSNDSVSLAASTAASSLTTRPRDRQVVLPSRLAQIADQSKSTDDFVTRTRDRQTVLANRLAEIVARDRQAKNPQVQEMQIAAVIDYANQGQFDQARQAVQAITVPPAVRTNILRKITVLETEMTQPTVVNGNAQARRILAMSKVARPRNLDQRTKDTAAAGPDWRTIPPRAERNFDLSVVNPTNPRSLAYNRLLAPNLLNNGDLQIVYPVPTPAPITSPFGWRVHPISGTRRFHSGTDIGAAQGTPVVAAYSGRVKSANYMGGYGLAITIEHKDGTLDTLYAHLSQAAVHPGDWVEQGTTIGAVGSTGASTGPHLHFEIRKLASDGWATLDPGPQLKQAREHLIQVINQARVDRPANHG